MPRTVNSKPAKGEAGLRRQRTANKKIKSKNKLRREIKTQSRLTTNVLSLSGRTTRITLPEKVFALSVKPETLAQTVRVYLTNQRTGTAVTKTRGEVRGGGRKPWRQKGTGRARQGSIRAPHWRGGGIIFGPVPRVFFAKLPKKVKEKALLGALTAKLASDEIKIIDGFENIKPKTKELVRALNKLNLPESGKSLIVVNGEAENLVRAGRNLPKIEFCKVANLTTYQIMAHPILIFTKKALTELEKRAS